jgi:hypothetical protein
MAVCAAPFGFVSLAAALPLERRGGAFRVAAPPLVFGRFFDAVFVAECLFMKLTIALKLIAGTTI